MKTNSPLIELAALFLRLGATAFGGPAAHIGLMENEVVLRRKWLTRQEFLDLLGATNLIPGPNSTELAIHIGYRRAGWRGLLVAGMAFIVPAALIVWAIAWMYVRFGALPQAGAVLYGIKPVIIAVVAHALLRLGGAALKRPSLVVSAVAGALLYALGMHELLVLFAGAGIVAAYDSIRSRGDRQKALSFGAGLVAGTPTSAWAAAAAASTPAATSNVTLIALFSLLFKTGSVLFGSGYVLLAFLRSDFVERLGWLTETQLLDAVAVGQFTPGPIFTTATFVGYLMAGSMGAFVATVGIFLPAFIFAGASAPFVPRLRKNAIVGRLLDGVNAMSLALMAVVSAQLARAAITDVFTLILALGALLLVVKTRFNSSWLILGGAAAGLLKSAWN